MVAKTVNCHGCRGVGERTRPLPFLHTDMSIFFSLGQFFKRGRTVSPVQRSRVHSALNCIGLVYFQMQYNTFYGDN